MTCIRLLLVMLVLHSCSRETTASLLGQPLLRGPSSALEGAVGQFQCEDPTAPDGEPVRFDLISPDVSFVVNQEVGGAYSALVSCRSHRGTPPITFSLHDRSGTVGVETVEGRDAAFKVPLVLDRPQGPRLQCRAQNRRNRRNRTACSDWMDLTVVRVSGPVELRSELHVGQNLAVVLLALRCSVPRGTFPRFRWLLDGTPLDGRGALLSPADHAPDRSILLVPVGGVGGGGGGTYRCEVSDRFDGASTISSPPLYVDRKALNRLPAAAVALAFGPFLFLVAVATACCCCSGSARGRRPCGETSLPDLGTGGAVVSYGDVDRDLDEEAYGEDVAVVTAARFNESDEVPKYYITDHMTGPPVSQPIIYRALWSL